MTKNHNTYLPFDHQNIDDDQELYGECGHSADNIDGTDFRCLICGCYSDALYSKQELEEPEWEHPFER